MLRREAIEANILKNILEERKLHPTAEYIAKEIGAQASVQSRTQFLLFPCLLALFPMAVLIEEFLLTSKLEQ